MCQSFSARYYKITIFPVSPSDSNIFFDSTVYQISLYVQREFKNNNGKKFAGSKVLV